MKNITFSFLVILFLPLLVFSQTITNIDYISPFNDGLAAIKKGNQWAFIDSEGTIVIDFRDDVVTSKFESDEYPVFTNNRCLISEKKEGITYYGYIDKTGTEVIKPEFLNATQFNNNTAIVLKLVKDTLGENNILKKPIVRYGYIEVVIEPDGGIINYLSVQPKLFTLSKKFMDNPPEITAKLLSDHLMAVWSQDKKWEIKKIE